ncbi:MAG TPA: transporter [Porphyromonadaceae bacterium]|jgi:BASS family bile acid:Na+ symporter|uniref:bile acid:sodium symporter family protein n=1 Tax=Petrimonas TaxID=307628 RepID=UPI000E922950|nr:transporter [Bacteroidales bacterium]BBD45894.1 Bile acid:sodium symporter [Petrimonas sp. IBARAKI]HBC39423.1 transporter [Porphyromonadaceae bacterium]HBF95136.1 transporter [Porphyromonadaceae bacterium]HBK93476.1 transporter [Porphyromonadaceae bacterium]
MQKFLEKYLLPIAMIIGIAFHNPLAILSPITPYLLSLMLFITYCRISWSDIRLTKFHYILLAIQYIGSALIYLAVRPFNETLAQAVMICVLAPTATSAPVVASILGGNIASVAAFSMFSNLSVAFVAPLYLSLIGQTGSEVPFITSFWYIFRKVVPIIVLPFFVALFLKKASPDLHRKVRSAQIVSFYIWAAALTVVIGNVANFVIAQDDGKYTLEIVIGLISLAVCLLQFGTGRMIGSRFDRTIAGGQGLGQKNTILAIWLTQTYLNPIASLGPGLYVLWQNLVNSYQIWRKNKKTEKLF